jgi:thermitase
MNNRSIPVLSVTLIVVLVLTALVPLAAARGGAQAIAPTAEFAPGRLLVKFRPLSGIFDSLAGADAARAVLAGHHLEVIREIPGLNVLVVSVPAGEELSTAQRLKRNLLVQYAEPDYILHAFTTPNDPYYATDQWNLPQINAPAAWDVTTGSSDVVVAIVDTGVDLGHPDLSAKIVAGYDFVNDDSTPQDDEGHGTHVAGIAAAATNNGVGVAGVSWGARLMPVKVLDREGSGYLSDVADGIRWAADHSARVVNLSLGGPAASSTLQNAVDYAYGRGLLIVAAAGNEYEIGNPVSYPAAYPHVMAVAATDDQDGHASYSNTGYYVDIAAPGGDPTGSGDTNPRHWIMSTYWRGASGLGQETGPSGGGLGQETGPSGGGLGQETGPSGRETGPSGGPSGVQAAYERHAGTSMATPHVAGLAALVWSQHPDWTNADVEWMIEYTAQDLGAAGRDDVFGWGRIDAQGAVTSPLQPTPTPTPSNCLAETPHPYSNNMSQTWTVTNPDAAAANSRVHFSRLETEPGWDEVVIKDEAGNVIQRLTGSYPSGVWSEPVPGRTVQVQLVTDSSITAWGFCLDRIETVVPITCLAETPHPYTNNMSQTWTVTNPDAAAAYSRVHFSRLETEACCDFVIFKDEGGNEIQRISGYHPDGLLSNPIPGRTVQVQLVTDYSVTAWGFCLDQIQTSPPPAWAMRAPLGEARSRLALAAVNGKLYAIGGESASAAGAKGQEPPGLKAEQAEAPAFSGAVEEYDPATNAWTRKAPMPTPLSNIAAGVLAGKIYIPGGWDGSGDSALVQVYDPAANSWTTAAPLPVGLTAPAAAVVNDRLYAIGGSSASNYVNTCYRYDPTANRWTQCAAMTYPRAWAAAGVVNGKIYVVGGADGSSEFNYVEEYDPVADSWTTKAPLSVARGGPGAVGVGNYLYVVGGGWSSYLNSAERYDPATNTWETIDAMNVGRRTLGLAELDGKLYAVGGWNGAYVAANETYTVGPVLLPEIDVVPASLSVTLSPGQTATRTLTIFNTGEGALTFGLAVAGGAWLSAAPISGSVPPTTSLAATVTFNAAGLAAGVYTGTVTVSSNDPDESRVTVPATLTVQDRAMLAVIPAVRYAGAGEIFTLDLKVAAGTRPVDAVDLYLSFDPARLHVVDASGNDTNAILPGGALPMTLQNSADNATGRIAFSAGRALGGSPPSGDFVAATIRFKALAETGPAGTPVHFLPGTDIFYQGNSVLQGTNDGLVIVQKVPLVGRVALQGHGAAPGGRWAGYPVRVALYAPGSSIPMSSTLVTLDSSGVFTVTEINPGAYDVLVKNPHSLSNRRPNVVLPVAAGPVNLGTLLEGDANDNDRVVGEDFSILATAYGTAPGRPGWDPRADFNDDATISGADFSLLVTNFGRLGPITVTGALSGPVAPSGVQAVNLHVNPSVSRVISGQLFVVDIALQAGSQTLDSVDVYLSFDPVHLRVVDASGGEVAEIIPGIALPLVLQNRVDNGQGQIAFSAGRAFGGTLPSGDLLLATIRFRALAADDPVSVPIAFTAGTDVFSQGDSVLGTRGDGAVIIGAGGRFLYLPVVTR